MTNIIKTILVGSMLLFAQPAAVAAGQQDVKDLQAAAREVDIMRRVLVKGLERAMKVARSENPGGKRKVQTWAGDPAEAATLDTYSNAALTYRLLQGNAAHEGTQVKSRAFMLPTRGAFFSLDFSVRGREVQLKGKSIKGKLAGEDLWDEARDEVEGRRSQSQLLFGTALRKGGKVQLSPVLEINPKALDAAIDTLLQLLVRHAGRMEHLPGDGEVILAATVRGQVPASTSRSRDRRAAVWLYSARGMATRRVIIRAPLTTLRQLRDASPSRKELRKRLSITQYTLAAVGKAGLWSTR